MNRDKAFKKWRPTLDLDNAGSKSLEEFQNDVLRPILKLQHEATLVLFRNHKHYPFQKETGISKEEYERVTNKFIKTNLDLKNQLIGFVIGLFTTSELEYYATQRKELNRRIIQMQLKRFVDTAF